MSPKLKRLLRNYANGVVNMSWIGSMNPDDHKSVRNSAKHAKYQLFTYLQELERRANVSAIGVIPVKRGRPRR